MDGVHALLARLRLLQYAPTFDELGYDDVLWMQRTTHASAPQTLPSPQLAQSLRIASAPQTLPSPQLVQSLRIASAPQTLPSASVS